MILVRLSLLWSLLFPPLLSAAKPLQPIDSLRAAALAAVQAQSPALQLTALPLDERLRLPRCDQALSARPEPQRGNQIRVAVACEGAQAWTVYLSLRAVELRPVLTLRRAVQRGEPLTADLLQAEPRDVALLGAGYYSNAAALQGLQLRRPAAAGSVLTPELVQAPQLVRRGDLVTVVGRSGSIEVRSQGKALRDGARGERVTVENASSRRIVEGEVNARGEVEVSL